MRRQLEFSFINIMDIIIMLMSVLIGKNMGKTRHATWNIQTIAMMRDLMII